MFLARENHHAKGHNLPANHHNFTTKNHHATHHFSQNPLQKRPSTINKKPQN
jgi:hypothetical protein